ncbi:MAG: NAD-dependent epimerase/dehydratase family protein, partial [Candidatus Subteraquimicrobiales bacterium]|nr:NAD-dependent epimerase/dehydratase family protein [Candidatus Subteraquimicrobiales bacterium]
MNNKFWNKKKVFLTGGKGFVGSRLFEVLKRNNAEVYLYDSDVRNYQDLLDHFAKSKASIIYHLAAQSLIEVGKLSPLDTFDINIRGTWNMLEVARTVGVEKIIIASTTHVYGDNPNLPYKEEYYPQPSRPYETSKASADLISQCYADTYSLPVEISRMVNLYGPEDMNISRLFPKIVNQLQNNINPLIFDIGAVRDFLYIDDAIDGYLKLGQVKLPNVKRARVINFGSGKPIKITDLAEKIIKFYGNKKLHLLIKDVPNEREKEIKQQYVS